MYEILVRLYLVFFLNFACLILFPPKLLFTKILTQLHKNGAAVNVPLNSPLHVRCYPLPDRI